MIELPVVARVKRVLLTALRQISKEDPQGRFYTSPLAVEAVRAGAFRAMGGPNIQVVFRPVAGPSPFAGRQGTEDRFYRVLPMQIAYFAEGMDDDPDLLTDLMLADIQRALPEIGSPAPLVDPDYAHGVIYTTPGATSAMYHEDATYLGVYAEYRALYWCKSSNPYRWDDVDPGGRDEARG